MERDSTSAETLAEIYTMFYELSHAQRRALTVFLRTIQTSTRSVVEQD